MIHLQIEGREETAQEGISILALASARKDYGDIYGAVWKGAIHDLNYVLRSDGELSFLRFDSEDGHLIYERSLHFLFLAAAHHVFPDHVVRLEHALSGGLFCVMEDRELSQQDVENIKQQMHRMVQKHCRIYRRVIDTEEAVRCFERLHMTSKASLLRRRRNKKSSIYELEGYPGYFYGAMLPDVSYLKQFYLRSYQGGVWLSVQPDWKDQSSLFQVFQEFEAWGRSIGVSSVAQLNLRILEGRMDELVLMSEAMLEYKLGQLVDQMMKEKPNTKCILISGPSSAGKTTFSRRLAIQLNIRGYDALALTMDNFYKNRKDSPRLPDGSYDFESLQAVDLPFFHKTMEKLLRHEPVTLPIFNFQSGCREWEDDVTTLKEHQLLIMEGIHGLNPEVSKHIPDACKFKIYINALTHLNLDEHNRIPTSDYRLIRRIVRDHQTRGWSARDTIAAWPNVRDGEDRYIYPYQETADVIFNTSMVYELAVLKQSAVAQLKSIRKHQAEYLEAVRLIRLLEYFEAGRSDAIPRSSILAEFLGSSIFHVS